MQIELSCKAAYKSILKAYCIQSENNTIILFFINHTEILKNTIHKDFWH